MSSMGIERIKEIYRYCEIVFDGQINKDKAAQELCQKVGYSESSHKMYFEIYRCMMLGKTFRRATNTEMIDVFLNQIYTKNGEQKLKLSLKAVYGYILYYYEKFGQSQPSMRSLCQAMADKYKIKMSFDMDMFKGISPGIGTQNIWIFQGNPKYYDVISAVDALYTIIWSVNQYQKQIKKGDRVYIWLSGTKGGIVASGKILCNPEKREWDSNDPYILSDEFRHDIYLAVDIQLERKFTDKIIEREMLLTDARTQKLEILTYNGATNFKVTSEQGEVIESIIDGTYIYVPVKNQDTEMSTEKRRYWVYAPGENSCMWDEFYKEKIMGLGWDELGDLTQYSSKDDMKKKMKEIYGDEYSYKNAGHATWQFAYEIQVGDIIFVKKGLHKLVGRGVVESRYVFDNERNKYKHIHSVNWTHFGEWDYDGQFVLKAFTDVTPYTDFCKKLESFFTDSEASIPEEEHEKPYIAYTRQDFLGDVFITEEDYNTIANLLKRKKNIILQGAPGVGKTYTAKRLAYSLMGEKDYERVMIVQFHQSYSYEDFVMGFRPSEKGFELRRGPFYEFCKSAEIDGREHYFIIDEINRGNLSKIFGELLMLIESDKRGQQLRLLYSDEQFCVPSNVYIIGMMNTADRSLAIIDYALRRRFSFFNIEPQFNNPLFMSYLQECGVEDRIIEKIIKKMNYINEIISQDVNLGKGFCIGHSYFCEYSGDAYWYENIVKYEIKPLLEEYYADEPSDVVDNYVEELLR